MKICMIGAGYVGLVSAACFSDFGWDVTCLDKDKQRVDDLNRGNIPIYEPGLEDLVSRNVAAGRMHFSNTLADVVRGADVIFLAVGTPIRRGDGHADLTYVFEAVEELAPHLNSGVVITTKSTVPVGTSREIERVLKALRPDLDVDVCSNPEFLREGSAIRDFTHPDRVLVGCDSERGRAIMGRLYEPLALRNAPIMFVSRESAELAKYAANAFLAMKVTFINEIADLCEVVGADVREVASAVGADGRIGSKFLHPGPGYGGSCFPKDVSALVRTAREAKAPVSLVEQVEKVNAERKIAMAARIEDAASGAVRNKTIALLGVTFKPNTDDMREAASLVIVPMLQARGASVHACDPQGRANAEELLPDVKWFENPRQAAENADILVVLTEWNEFRALDLKDLRRVMRGDVLVDLRNVYSPELARAAGFSYSGIGRGSVAVVEPLAQA
ncbi:MAG: UDP-glucose 6-dehydrogenase [Methyloceanibacter sp.]|nr:MAG: UDP-glucose 6-dehydrogenase [Methyloceanibacter sp.]